MNRQFIFAEQVKGQINVGTFGCAYGYQLGLQVSHSFVCLFVSTAEKKKKIELALVSVILPAVVT